MLSKILHYFLPFLTFSAFYALNMTEDDCDRWAAKHVYTPNNLHFSNMSSIIIEFKAFEDLNFSCPNLMYQVEALRMFSQLSVMMDNNLDLSRFLSMFRFNKAKTNFLFIQTIKGFNRNLNAPIKNVFNTFIINLENSNFNFYSNNKINRCI